MTILNVFRVVATEGRQLTLHANHTYGWDWAWQLVPSRSMALRMLWESLTPLAPLAPALRDYWNGPHYVGNFADVARFISCVGVVDRQDHHEMLNDATHEYWSQHNPADFPNPQATYLIAVTDPKWIAHLVPEMEWHSTAYDDDPKVSIAPAWRTLDVVLLAKRIRESQEFSAMPILADALQDAGCDSADILNHLRDPHAAHVRGCWALDLVLGKE